ncbi:hypothetical protein P153DRAFT_371231 [Dothidotthia symphoricarpi CBS 119687]|uniref:Uncharacterized protein n=1 Tax=Dothidotthia symphoricarpi CBS 119687 TaxID=1392245 RepID=A0A6A5ZYC2_9PLEO|nr:uncharacterized protein P153DRAFT_371231 [Dothidotthia symphoricarpi CBS 119687]KAF2123904.1 hypothetical protein P153DRAFT_371231 [Dothidotthia symphoricarpi CBS 119687]
MSTSTSDATPLGASASDAEALRSESLGWFVSDSEDEDEDEEEDDEEEEEGGEGDAALLLSVSPVSDSAAWLPSSYSRKSG